MMWVLKFNRNETTDHVGSPLSCCLGTPESTWTPRASRGTHRSALLAFLLDGLLRHSSLMSVALKHRGVHWQTVSLLRHCTLQPVAVRPSLKKQNQSTGLWIFVVSMTSYFFSANRC